MKKYSEYVDEATKWKKGDGRPRGGSHIENVKFWDLPDASLKYIQKDATAAMKANPKGKKAGKYADEVNDAATVLFWRKKNKIVVTDKPGFKKHQEEVELEEGNFQLNVDTTVAIKVKGKMLYGKVESLEKVQGKPGVVVRWSDKTSGRFKMSAFASIMGDKKADYVVDA